MLTSQGCLLRRRRLLSVMEHQRWDLFFTGNHRTVYYLTGAPGSAEIPGALLVHGDGRAVLFSASGAQACADEVVKIETYSITRVIDSPFQDAARLIREKLPASGRAAVERTGTCGLFESLLAGFEDASRAVLGLRKRKEADEIEEIRGSLRLSAAAYRAARQTIAPGLTEVDVYNAMYAAVTREAACSLDFAGDFACGERSIRGGGPPTGRRLEPGDLYILDLFPAPALYFGDVCRTFAVGQPTDLQRRAWEAVRDALRTGEAALRPGLRARDLYVLIRDSLESSGICKGSFWHHAGHGIGHHGHEAPRLIPASEDVLEEGDVLTLEPGLYGQSLHGGIRLENNYLLHASGAENLFDFPLEL